MTKAYDKIAEGLKEAIKYKEIEDSITEEMIEVGMRAAEEWEGSVFDENAAIAVYRDMEATRRGYKIHIRKYDEDE